MSTEHQACPDWRCYRLLIGFRCRSSYQFCILLVIEMRRVPPAISAGQHLRADVNKRKTSLEIVPISKI
ncbi:hypothetical protein J6590_001184 [Homalodisca vitripennis]|nr:hypothetical protein J6590_001184 [Homalodisca vitripennis]